MTSQKYIHALIRIISVFLTGKKCPELNLWSFLLKN